MRAGDNSVAGSHNRRDDPTVLFEDLQAPLQYRLFAEEPEPVPVVVNLDWFEDQERRICKEVWVVWSDNNAQIVVAGFGIFLSKKSERMLVRTANKVLYEFPLFRISEVVVQTLGVTISSDLIQELCARGIRLCFLHAGKPYAMISSPLLTATVQTRLAQFAALGTDRGVGLSKILVQAKLKNQAHLLKYFGKHLKKKDPGEGAALDRICSSLDGLRARARSVEGCRIDDCRNQLMGIEGAAGRLYWEGVTRILGGDAFERREHRGAASLVNALINYGYGILYGEVWGAVLNAGLEPFAGFLHVERPGKPSLVLDLVEEFRQPVVDQTVFAAVNLGRDFRMENGLLSAESRKLLASMIVSKLQAEVSFAGKRYALRSVIQTQARRVAKFLRGEGPYKAYAFRW